MDEHVKRCFLLYSWPGNVRELENAIEYAVNVSESDVLHADCLQDKFNPQIHADKGQECSLREMRQTHIRSMLEKYGRGPGAKKTIAAKLGIGLATLYRDIKKYNLG
jgi:transcriptional regulator with PAS, ATPase and Fis domain